MYADFRQPGLKGALCVIVGKVLQCLEPRVLIQIICVIGIGAQCEAEAIQPPSVLPDVGVEHSLRLLPYTDTI